MNRLAALVLCLCLVAEAAPAAKVSHKRPVAVSSKKAALLPPAVARPTTPWMVDIHELVPSLRPMPQKEREDQLRDWALYGLLMHLGLSEDALARTTHEIAPVRLPYLEELFAFEYGRGRRAILSDERVLLLYERDDPDPQATLGRLADRVRMEMGSVPKSFELYSFSADVTHGELHVEPKEVLPGQTLFSELYGYHEVVVADREAMGRWLDSVDDVTYVAQVDGGIKLGGRRFDKSRTRGATLEDVAALYQAHSGLATQRQQQTQHLEDLNAKAKRELEDVYPDEAAESARLFPHDREAQRKELNRRMNARVEQYQAAARKELLPIPPEPGFSLDPQLKSPELVATLTELAADPCRTLEKLRQQTKADTARLESTQALPGTAVPAKTLFERDPKDFRTRCEALGQAPTRAQLEKIATSARTFLTGASEKEALAPFYALKSQLKDALDKLESSKNAEAELKSPKSEADRFLLDTLELAQQANHRQCARYDGPLGGTRVGMNLFYTDLLAKLWALDVRNSAPAMRVPGFLSLARLPGSAFREEDLSRSYTRVWFGPRKESFTRSADESELRFQHVATRVFAAGSDPDRPGTVETTPSERSRRAIGWWERHYGDVADYEQEYHLQNQVMKWSIITGYFRAKGAAAYLDQVPVGRTEQFGKWYAKERPELRYQLPLQVGGETGQECMDILATKSGVSGGVSLAGEGVTEVAVLETAEEASLRHGLKSMLREKSAQAVLGRALPEYAGSGLIRVEPLPSTLARMENVQFQLGPMEIVFSQVAKKDYELTLRTLRAPVGNFLGSNAEDRVLLTWQPRELAVAPGLAGRVYAKTGESLPLIVDTFKPQALGKAAVHSWPSQVLVQDTYDVLVPDAAGGGYTRMQLSNAVSPGRAAPAELPSVLSPYPWQRVTHDKLASGLETSAGVVRSAVKNGPGAEAHIVQILGEEGLPDLKVAVSKDGALYLPNPSQPGAVKSWAEQAYGLTSRDLDRIYTAAQRGKSVLTRAELSNPSAELAARALAGEDVPGFQGLLKKVSKEVGPEQGAQDVRRHVEAVADLQLTHGDTAEASRLYALASSHFDGTPPEVLIRQTLADMHTGKVGPESLEVVLRQHASKLTEDEGRRVVMASQGLITEMPEAPEVLMARLDFQSSIPADVAPRIQWERDGPDVVSTFHSEKPLTVEGLAKDEVKNGAPRDATYYVEDAASFNNVDFETNPAENVAEMWNNPEFDVKRVRDMGTGTFRPGKVYAKKASEQGQKAAQGAAEHSYRRVAGPYKGDASQAPIYLIQHRSSCDKDGDGRVSEQEAKDC